MQIGRLPYILIFLLTLLSPNPLLMGLSSLSLIFVLRKFSRVYEVKMLLLVMLSYWLMVAVLLPYGAIFSIPLKDLAQATSATEGIEMANFLGVVSLFIFGAGILLQIRKLPALSFIFLQQLLSKYDSFRLFLAYVIYSLILPVIQVVVLGGGGGQMLIGLIYFKWVFLSFLIVHTLIFKTNQKYVITFVLVEILLSFSGFWAEFKDYILVAVAAFMTISRKLTIRQWIYGILAFCLTYIFFVVWTFSKGEYRRYLTGGERSQVIIQNDAIENLSTLWTIIQKDFSSEKFNENFKTGSTGLLYRISYIEYFARAITVVPNFIPYEDGKLLKDAFLHVLQPRILFPNKAAIYDSEITSKYTGTQFASKDEGVSFSFGMVPERYVDFGPVYMFVPILFFGMWIGFMYRKMLEDGYNRIWGMCFTAPIFNFAISYGLPTTKFLGWSITYFFTFLILNKYVIRRLDQWLLKKEYRS
jgi:hypothetical protein